MLLFEPRTSKVNRAVYKEVASLSGDNYIWLGITDMQDGVYRYESNKKEVEDGMWASGQQKGKDYHCVWFGGRKFKSSDWQDYLCSRSTHSICEEI